VYVNVCLENLSDADLDIVIVHCVQAIVSDINTMFIENVIFIMKNILENKAEQPNDHLGITSIEGLMLAVVRYVGI